MAEKGASTHPGLTWQGVVENTDPGNIQELGWMQRWSQHDGIVPCHASVVSVCRQLRSKESTEDQPRGRCSGWDDVASAINVTQASKAGFQQLEALVPLASKLGTHGALHIWTVLCAMPHSHHSCGSHDATACCCKPYEGLLSTADPALQLLKPLQIHRLQHAPLQLGSETRRLTYMKL